MAIQAKLIKAKYENIKTPMTGTGNSTFDFIIREATEILSKYPLVYNEIVPYLTKLQMVAELYYVFEDKLYPTLYLQPYPKNIPQWKMADLIAILNVPVSVYGFKIESLITDANDRNLLFDYFKTYAAEIKKLADKTSKSKK